MGQGNEQTLVIQDNDTPLAVLLTYERFLVIQEKLTAVFNTVEMLTDTTERTALLAALADVKAGRVRSLDEIESEMEEK